MWHIWAFISFHFGLLGLHFLSFWPFGPWFPFMLAFWAFISFPFGFLGTLFSFCKWQILEKEKLQNLNGKLLFGAKSWLGGLWAFISFHFGLLGLHFLSFLHFGPSFPFILAFWAFISFHSGLLGLHFLSFWSFGPSFLFILVFWAPFLALQVANFGKEKNAKFRGKIAIGDQILAGWLLGLHFFSFWSFGLHFLSFWLLGLSFPFILAFWAFICFHFGFLGAISGSAGGKFWKRKNCKI